MPRLDADPRVYSIAERFVDSCLRRDDSLFTPGRAIWSLPYLDELDLAYVQNPDLGPDPFEVKLRRQLSGVSPAALQLMAETLFVYYLPARGTIGGDAKRQKIQEVLGWSSEPVALSPDLAAVLDFGIGSGGTAFNLYKWASLSFLLRFSRQWKLAEASLRGAALADPWLFHDFVAQIPAEGGIYGRESMLHLVFPDTFERAFSGADKSLMATRLNAFVDDPHADLDRQISQIRAKLARRFGPDFDFYATDGVRALWKRFEDRWAEFIYWASRFKELPEYGPGERDYKLQIVQRLTDARKTLAKDGDWFPTFKGAFGPPNNLTAWQAHDPLLKWCQEDLVRSAKLLRRLWLKEEEPLIRLGEFLGHLPHAVIPGLGSRTTIGSFLLFGLDPFTYPPYRVAAMHGAYRLTGYEPGDEKDEVAMYRAGLGFFDQLRERSGSRGLELEDRLDVQSVVWCVANWPTPANWPDEDRAAFDRYRQAQSEEIEDGPIEEAPEVIVGDTEPPTSDPLPALARDLLFEESAVREIAELLTSKGQVVFYGPPGTGKTFVARKLAITLAGDAGRVRLVQFHPSYSYEDFVEGYRPHLYGERVPGFKLTAGPMKSFAERAIEDPGHEYVLIIDELNRGNIPKVFGELYFLLEYRDEEVVLQYSSAPFRLPPNVRLIATMNTADRSIALLDAALRRRFSFVPFFPDRPPVEGLLRRWLRQHRSEMEWVADVVDLANTKLGDRNAAIGPSYFMKKDLNQGRLERIWRHEILPYLEDFFFDAPDRLEDFGLAKLSKANEGVLAGDSAAGVVELVAEDADVGITTAS